MKSIHGITWSFLMKKFLMILRTGIMAAGIFFVILALLALTRIPFDIHRFLGEHASAYRFTPEVLVMMGGSGMPSESNLIRLYYLSQLADKYPDTRILIAHPHDITVADKMKSYLIVAGVDSSRIHHMPEGTNTREQAAELKKHFPGYDLKKTVIVTSPENMYRTIRVFRKLDYKFIGGEAAFENAMFVDLNYNHRELGGKVYTPDVSGNLSLRYNFWNYLKLEITCLREAVAILYYKLNGWI